MFLLEMLLALVLAAIAAGILATTRRSEATAFLPFFVFYFLLLFPIIWAGGVWVTPLGPTLGGVAWLGFVLVGLFLVILLLAAAVPSRPPETPGDVTPANAGEEALKGTAVFFGLAFWLLLVAALAAVVARYAGV